MAKIWKDYKIESRAAWGTEVEENQQPNHEQIKLGALFRMSGYRFYIDKTELPPPENLDSLKQNSQKAILIGHGQPATFNAKLDKFSQPLRPGPNLDKTAHDIGTILKSRPVNKSSKGKHPSNYTPPKKKRK